MLSKIFLDLWLILLKAQFRFYSLVEASMSALLIKLNGGKNAKDSLFRKFFIQDIIKAEHRSAFTF